MTHEGERGGRQSSIARRVESFDDASVENFFFTKVRVKNACTRSDRGWWWFRFGAARIARRIAIREFSTRTVRGCEARRSARATERRGTWRRTARRARVVSCASSRIDAPCAVETRADRSAGCRDARGAIARPRAVRFDHED